MVLGVLKTVNGVVLMLKLVRLRLKKHVGLVVTVIHVVTIVRFTSLMKLENGVFKMVTGVVLSTVNVTVLRMMKKLLMVGIGTRRTTLKTRKLERILVGDGKLIANPRVLLK